MNQGQLRADRVRFLIKCGGAIALLNYFLFFRFDFNVMWFICALLLALGAPLLYAWFTTTLRHVSNATADRDVAPAYRAERFLVAAEDGAFLLPLLFLGINVYTALCAAVLFAIFRHKHEAMSYTVMLGVSYFTMALWVLPQGLWMVVAGHAVAAIVLDQLFPRWFDDDMMDRHQAETTR